MGECNSSNQKSLGNSSNKKSLGNSSNQQSSIQSVSLSKTNKYKIRFLTNNNSFEKSLKEIKVYLINQ